jgi:hypothetical protein
LAANLILSEFKGGPFTFGQTAGISVACKREFRGLAWQIRQINLRDYNAPEN